MERNGKNLICPICENEFYVKKSHIKRRVFCSLECRNIGYNGRKFSEIHKINISNSLKGKPKHGGFGLGYKHSDETKEKMRKFNLGWFNKGIIPKSAFKKGHKPWSYIDGRSRLLSPGRYGDDWDKIRYLVYLRDNFTCRECGEKMSKIPFHVHHKIPFLVSFDNSLENLETLCPSCHRKIEAEIMKMIKSGGLIIWKDLK